MFFKKMFKKESPLLQKLQAWTQAVQANPSHAPELDLDELELQTAEEAQALHAALQAVRAFPLDETRYTEGELNTPLHSLLGLIQDVQTEAAMQALGPAGEQLRRLVQDGLARSGVDGDTLLFAIKQLALSSGHRDSADLVLRAMRQREPVDLSQQYWWSIALSAYSEPEHPQSAYFFQQAAQELPRDFCAVSLLDAANGYWRACEPPPAFAHPFDQPAGLALLRGWLTQPHEDTQSYAVSACAGLPFLKSPPAADLLAAALAYPDESVQVEAAWACLKSANASAQAQQAARQKLIDTCAVAHEHHRAAEYLRELGLAALIPAHTQTPAFQARAEMAQWLAHPNEFGRPPLRLDCLLSTDLLWPPTGDRRTLHVFQYEYLDDEGAQDIGHGLVGSVTFALFGATDQPGMTPSDVLALHCAWEMHCNGEAGFENDYTADQARALLRQHNPGWV